jgi:hypothetical protein
MKKKNVTIAILAFLMFVGVSKLNAQETAPTEKRSIGTWLTKTPWIVNFSADIINDNLKGGLFPGVKEFDFYPAKFTCEKILKKGWSGQLAFASTGLQPHTFFSTDLNFKYDFNNLIGDTKWFDPFSILGLGYTYRQPFYAVKTSNQVNLNVGLGANFWLFPNMGITTQGLAKFGSDKYLNASLGLVFKIGNCEAPKCEVAPKTQEAQDALQHLRGIINK